MRLTITIQMDAERDREGETADDEQRTLALAEGVMRDCTSTIVDAAQAEGMEVSVRVS